MKDISHRSCVCREETDKYMLSKQLKESCNDIKMVHQHPTTGFSNIEKKSQSYWMLMFAGLSIK